LLPLDGAQKRVYDRILHLDTGLFSFAHLDAFQQNIARGLPTSWHCPAGGRFLYICEDGLVHYCSQQRGRPGIPLDEYSVADLVREGTKPKGCAPFCTISCVHQTAMLDEFRTRPRAALSGIIERRQQRDPGWQVPISVRTLERIFLRDSRTRDFFAALAVRAFGLRKRAT
jgi:hypothetical protein